MSRDPDEGLTCPFCGRTYDEQAELTDHFQAHHDFSALADD